jgi:hypothetical protein
VEDEGGRVGSGCWFRVFSSVNSKKKTIGVGILACDHMGKVLGAMCSV